MGLGGGAGLLGVDKVAEAGAVDRGEVGCLPRYSVLSHLVYATGRGAVTDVWVDGAPLLVDRRLTTLNEAALRVEMAAWAAKVKPATASTTAVGGQ